MYLAQQWNSLTAAPADTSEKGSKYLQASPVEIVWEQQQTSAPTICTGRRVQAKASANAERFSRRVNLRSKHHDPYGQKMVSNNICEPGREITQAEIHCRHDCCWTSMTRSHQDSTVEQVWSEREASHDQSEVRRAKEHARQGTAVEIGSHGAWTKWNTTDKGQWWKLDHIEHGPNETPQI